ncbi:Protoheme IX farnesyltransferase, mitochondrial [Coemansia sp. Benny D115]|nr:Protoheme IX farnesyltransferase, mitochondrial [Coemansia sp. Benny D115]
MLGARLLWKSPGRVSHKPTALGAFGPFKSAANRSTATTSAPLRSRRNASSSASSSADQQLKRAGSVASASASESVSTAPASGLTTQRDPRQEMGVKWRIQSRTPVLKIGRVYGDLSKDKLTGFVVLTAMAGYAIAPGAAQVGTLLWTTLGTTLCSASANSFNQWIEVPYDAQMSRTRNRPLARQALTPLHALAFGVSAGIGGVVSLWVFVNPLTATLGLANIVLYAGVYTAMKRMTIANTWVGSLVGAIPPLMGWAAATGSLGPGAWVLGGIMFAWQFPHDLRYSLLMFPLCAALPALGLTDPWFLLDSSAINAFMAYCAYDFWRHPDAKKSRRLFFSSLAHLPILLTLIMLHKFVQERRCAAANDAANDAAAAATSRVE